MKKRSFLISSIFLLGFILIPLNINAQENTNVIKESEIQKNRATGIFDLPDDNLQKAMVDDVNRNTGSTWDIDNMPEDELLKTTNIQPLKEVGTLDGLDYYIQKGLLNNVTNILLSNDNNTINDISPIAGLTSLEGIQIANANISDISVLENMTKLQFIDFSNNKISDISVLGSFSNLTSVAIGSNNITDISPLSNNVNMRTLHVDDNKISDISAVTNMSQLEDFAGSSNLITDISPLANKPNLWVAYLGNNKIYDLSPLYSGPMIAAENQNIEFDLGDFDDIKLLPNEVSIYLIDGTEVKVPYGLDINDIVDYDDYSYTVSFNQDAGFTTFNGKITVIFSYVAPIPLTPLDPSIPITTPPVTPVDPTDPSTPDKVDNKKEKETIGKKLIQTGKENFFIISSFVILLISLKVVVLNKRV